MRAVDLIAQKRDGGELSTAEIEWLIANYTHGNIPDYQMAAWAMAVLWRGMTLRETTDLTLAMARSGAMLDLSDIAPVVGDKHSTGGVGDKATLLVAPLVAALGLPFAKMSGRGLGFSGGTIDKLESIPGLQTELSPDAFRAALQAVGLVVAAPSDTLAPADGRLYALRDVTATVPSIPLIAASIMSKKLAAGTTCIILDVKYGNGAFMRAIEQAQELARTMVGIGQRAGRKTMAVISSMEQPLGCAIGNALEVREAIETLQHTGPPDLEELCFRISAYLAVLSGQVADEVTALKLLHEVRDSGAAWHKFRQMIVQQGGDGVALDDPAGLPHAPVVLPLAAPSNGYVAAIDTQALGMVTSMLGGGRTRKGDPIDPAVGLVLMAKVGDAVRAGEPLLSIHAATEVAAHQVAPHLLAAYTLADHSVRAPPILAGVITAE